MSKATNPAEVWADYEKGVSYNTSINLYETVKQNENFYIGKQWEGLKAPDLDTPVLNFVKRVISYFISQIVTDNVGIQIHMHNNDDAELKIACDLLQEEVEKVIEDNKIVAKNRDVLRDAAVDGDVCCYVYNDNGDIRWELVDNTRVIFGDRFTPDVQSQPYIIVVRPMILSTAKKIAKSNGVDPDNIKPDYEELAYDDKSVDDQRVTMLFKFWKDDAGKVHYCQTTKDIVIKKDTALGYKLYPIAFMNWERIKDSYHGQAAITGLIPNQIAVNKLWAMALRHEQMMAFPKIAYDRTKIATWSNRIGEAIAVYGDPNQSIMSTFRGADMSAQLPEIVDRTISYTRDFMGASDAALGNVKPDNTSAIIAVQQASSAPLELQKLSFYQFVEDYVRIIVEIITTDSAPTLRTYDNDGITAQVQVDFSNIPIDQFDIKVDVGAAAYWSELSQISTLDALYTRGIITDPIDYLEAIPDNYIKNKQQLIKKLEELQSKQSTMAKMGGETDAMSEMQTGAENISLGI